MKALQNKCESISDGKFIRVEVSNLLHQFQPTSGYTSTNKQPPLIYPMERIHVQNSMLAGWPPATWARISRQCVFIICCTKHTKKELKGFIHSSGDMFKSHQGCLKNSPLAGTIRYMWLNRPCHLITWSQIGGSSVEHFYRSIQRKIGLWQFFEKPSGLLKTK